MVIKDLIKEISKSLSIHDTELLIKEALSISTTDYVLGKDKEISESEYKKVIALASKISNGMPLQYAVGKTEFMSLEFDVNENVLIPRPDTETLVETVINKIGENEHKTLLDIGTGSGCIGISIAYYRKNLKATLLDFSEKALETAKINTKKNNVTVEFTHCDIMKNVPHGSFDIIVSNPPYIEKSVIPTLDKNVKDYEPHSALDGGDDGLDFYRRITAISKNLLNDGGMLAYEVGYNQSECVCEIMKQNGFINIETKKDLCGINRVVSAQKP